MIVSSEIVVDTNNGVQRSVTEKHAHDNGEVYTHSYVTDMSADVDAIMLARAQKINTEIARLAQIEAESNNFEIPLTKIDIHSRITTAEWEAFKNSTNADVRRAYDIFQGMTSNIHRNSPLTQAMFAAIVADGIMTQARADEVLA